MLFNIPHKRRLLCTAIATLSLLPISGMTLAQNDPRVEEVVVTGSFIRRSEGLTQASSIVQLTAEDLEAEGTLNLAEVVNQMSFVNGVSSAVVNMPGQGAFSRTASIDLRGLGARSTLTLFDGKRLVNENVNALIPSIALQRIDIVADGAAALYGSEAVAGVVNFIPYSSYEGLKIESFAEGDSRGDWDQHSVQAIWGGNVGEIDVVLAGQFRQQSRLGRDERDELTNSGNGLSANAPGNWRAPVRNASGQYTGAYRNVPDPNCAPASERTSYSVGEINNPYGMRLGNNCWVDFGDGHSFFNPEQHNKLFGNATWDFNDDLTLSLQGFHSRLYEKDHRSTGNASNARVGELPAVRGEIPGNPFRAVNASGMPLFGVDVNGDGVPDRNPGIDLNNDGWDDYIVSGTVNNGVPLNEDVLLRTFRPVNKTHTTPSGHTGDMDDVLVRTDRVSRWSLQADFAVPFVEGWEGMAAWTQNRREFDSLLGNEYDITAMIQGLNCDVARDRDACYNPFLVVNQADNNSQLVMDAIVSRGLDTVLDKLTTFDLVLNGEIPLQLPGGTIGAAVGYQFREDSYVNTPTELALAGIAYTRSTVRETITRGRRDVDSYFLELAIPVLADVEIEAAVRREEFSTGQASTDPKFGATWRTTDWLTLRATTGDAFIAPTLQQLLDPVTCGLTQVIDKFTDFSGFSTGCGGGNPNLENEFSESIQFGVDLALGDFDFSVTWNNTAFENRIINTNGQQIVDLDYFNFQQATGFAGNGSPGNKPTLEQLRDWINNPASSKQIIRDPLDLRTILQVEGLGSGNAEEVEVTAYDMQGNYSFGLGNYGDVRIGLQATYIDEFLVQEDPTQPVFDGVGKQNNGTGSAPALPSWKANLRVGWTLNNHAVVATTRYVDAIDYDGPTAPFLDNFGGTFRPADILETGIKAWTDMDLAYTYRGLSALGGDWSFTLGARNVFDREAQGTPMPAGIVAELQDPRGRILYGRLVYEL